MNPQKKSTNDIPETTTLPLIFGPASQKLDPGPAQLRPGLATEAMAGMFSGLARHYDLANRVMSLGRDSFWRSALSRRLKVLDPPGRLLDLATGTGDQIVSAKRARPDLAVTGLDLAKDMIDLAYPKLVKLPPPTPEMLVGDALAMAFEEETYDSVSISFGLRNISARADLYREVRRVLKPGGRFLVLEASHDRNSLLAPIVRYYLNEIMPALGGWLVSRQPEAYRYLAATIMAFPRPKSLAADLAAAGFENLGWRTYTFNTVMLVWGDKPKASARKPGRINIVR